MRALIVDDEPLARDGIRLLLAGDPAVIEIGEARNGRDAIAMLGGMAQSEGASARWDVVFLDVQMPEIDGFGVVEAIGADRMPSVVFVTAHDRFAIRAFEINAIDYLQKPVTRERFARALDRVKARRRAADRAPGGLPGGVPGGLPGGVPGGLPGGLIGLLETLAAAQRGVKRLAVKSAGKTELVDVDDIDWIEAAENYVQLHVGKAAHLLHVTMAALEKTLDPTAFLRVHRSIIVRIDRIRSLAPTSHGEYVITLASGATLRSGRSYGDRLRALADNPF